MRRSTGKVQGNVNSASVVSTTVPIGAKLMTTAKLSVVGAPGSAVDCPE
jgi:hypothetical protein